MGSGKSYLLQLMPLLLADDPKSTCIMFRRTTPQIAGQGGIWDTAKNIYLQLDPEYRPRIREKDMKMIFPDYTGERPSGMSIKYSHMQNEDDKYNIQGLTCSPLMQ